MEAVFENQDGVARSISNAPPAHYTLKIQLFSLLVSTSGQKYESAEFEAGGHKWKLVLHPNGNKSRNVKDHLSLYLAMSNTSSLKLGWEVHAIFRFFLLDQNKDNYLVVQDALLKEKRFHGLKLEWGIDQFLPLKTFNDASNGFLVEDTCVFGAEVFVVKERVTGKGECLSMIKDPLSIKHVWKIENFLKSDTECFESKIFVAGDQKWKIQLYPKGRRHGNSSHLSLYLVMADSTTLSPASKIYAEFTLRILDQVQARHIAGRGNYWFNASNQETGWARFATLSYFNQHGNGLLVKDVCLVEAEVIIHGIASVARSISDAPPANYTLKIQKLVLHPNGKRKNVKDHLSLYLAMSNTSSLKLGWEVYAVFKFFMLDQNKDNYLVVQDTSLSEGKTPWKRRSSLSLYLVTADSKTLSPASKIYAEFTLRILDQVQARHVAGKGNYLLNASNQETGWARFATLSYFNEPGNGLLVKDVCLVQAEVTIHGIASAL
ncbi:hypothetical protein QYF36_021090 [Acer negundo]|nr:hypothetical protein QYF36_021090 [Acer negundo]